MKRTSRWTTWGMLATLAAASVSPALADGYQSRADQQQNKNTARNLTIAGAAVAVYGLLNHNNTLALIGAAGAGLAGSQYEKDRQQQSQDSHHYYYRDGRNPNNNNWNRNDNNAWNQDNNGNWNRNDGRAPNHDWNRDNDNNWNRSDGRTPQRSLGTELLGTIRSPGPSLGRSPLSPDAAEEDAEEKDPRRSGSFFATSRWGVSRCAAERCCRTASVLQSHVHPPTRSELEAERRSHIITPQNLTR